MPIELRRTSTVKCSFRRVVVLAVVAVLFGSAHASASVTALALGQGDFPGVGLDESGNALVGWRGVQDAMGIRPLMFCRVPRGASGCDGDPKVIVAPGTSESFPAFVASGTRVVVAQSRASPDPASTGLFFITSMDAGSTFGAANKVGQAELLLDAVAGPGDSMSVVGSYSFELGFENIALSAVADEPGFVRIARSDFLPYGAVDLDGVTPVVLAGLEANTVTWRRYVGSGSLNDVANWSWGVEPFYLSEQPGLAGGPLGLFAAGRDLTSGSPVVRRFGGAGFANPAVIEQADASPRVEQDASGRLHAVYGTSDLRYAVSDDGVNWRAGTLVRAALAAQTRLAVAADHSGAVVYSSGGQIQLAWLSSDGPPPDSSAGAGPPQPPPPPAPAPPPPPPAPPPASPGAIAVPRGTLTTKARKSVSIAGGRITLSAPQRCVPPGESFIVRFGSTRTRGARFLAISRADFYVDGRRRAIDRHKPFKQRLRLAGFTAGTSHELKARATLRLRDSRPITRTLTMRLRYCST